MKIQTEQNTRNAKILSTKESLVELPKSRTTYYGIQSITDQSARIWNYMQITQAQLNLHLSSRNVCKEKLKNLFVETY